ncbi:MAG: RNA 3'-terminal phosphate cyclase [Haloferacaceae archaeon]
MLDVDGEAGGGQVVRTAVSLAALTGTPVRVTNVRGARPDPGLRPQHCASIRAVASCCDAECDGVEVASEAFSFDPDAVTAGEYAVDIGTAGSVTLLFDALLPLAAVLDDPLSVSATGGTDVKWSPTVGHYRTVKLPLAARFGFEAAVSVERTGFYPAGGGTATLRVSPSTLEPATLLERGALRGVAVDSKAAESLRESEVADRQAAAAVEALEDRDVPVTDTAVRYVETASPGSAVLLRAEYDGTVAGFDSLGERGLPAEEVAARAVEAFDEFRTGAGAVDEHTADQLLVPLALAGGRVRVPSVTAHVETNREVLDAFGGDVRVERGEDGVTLTSDGALGSRVARS